MKPAPFTYHAPETVADCLTVLREYGDETKILAGGQSLVPMLALRLARPEHLVDVNRVGELAAHRREGDELVLGATTRHRFLERDPEVTAAVPLLARAAPLIGHFQIRNRGTLGGSLVHADPAGELPTVVRVLDAELEATGPNGSRRIAAADFFETIFTTSLEPEEMLTAVRFPARGPGAGFAVEEFSRRHGDFALVGAMVAVQVRNGVLTRASIGLTGMGTVPERATAVEERLAGAAVDGLDLVDVGVDAVRHLTPADDVHARGTYRRRVGASLVTRALTHALEEAADA